MSTDRELRAALADLVQQWERDRADYPDTSPGRVGAAAVRACRGELLAVLRRPVSFTPPQREY